MTGRRRTERSALSSWGERLRIFLLFSVALVGLELANDVYRWFAYDEERAELRALGPEVDSAGLEVIRTQLRVDSLRLRIEAADSALEASRVVFTGFDRRADHGRLSPRDYDEYRERVAAYNDRVGVRNVHFSEWQRAISDNRDAVKRYNDLADEIRTIAARMGEQHYNVPTPVEAAVRNGLEP